MKRLKKLSLALIRRKTPTTHNYLKHLHPKLKKPLRETIDELAEDPERGKPLQEELTGFRSHRLKKYRVIYRYLQEKDLVEILFAGPRKNVYQLFSSYLKKLKRPHPSSSL